MAPATDHADPDRNTTAVLTERVDAVLDRIATASNRAGRDSAEILLLLATKTRTPQQIAAAVELLGERGQRIAVGENRAQEIAKHNDPLVRDNGVPRHFIGRLQTNKARDVVAFADLIHSVDRDDIAAALSRRAGLAGTPKDVLIQVNTSGEESKGGYAPRPEVIADVAARLHEDPWLRPVGLMTIGANTPDEQAVRASLRLLRSLREDLADPAIAELSMGMSADLEIAIEEGATIVRLGSAVFGARPSA